MKRFFTVPGSFRWKILLTLLATGIGPLLIAAWLDAQALRGLGEELAQQSGRDLGDQTRAHLTQLTAAYAREIDREREAIELIVRLQAREATELLRSDGTNTEIYWSDDFDTREQTLELIDDTDNYFRQDANGERVASPVSFRHQVFFSPAGEQRAALAPSAQQLAALSEMYREVHKLHGDSVFRQFVALDNGLIGSFPGHGGFPAAYDPRKRAWYTEQIKARDLHWSGPHVDAITGRAFLNASAPILNRAGELVGVAGLDVELRRLLNSFVTESSALGTSEVVLAYLTQDGGKLEPGKIVVAERSGVTDADHATSDRGNIELLIFANESNLAILAKEMAAAQAGYLRVNLAGRDVYCIYRPFGRDSYLLFMLPTATVTSPGVRAASYALQSTQRQIDRLLPLALIIIVGVIVVAVLLSRTIIRPVQQLVSAATKVGRGDFSVRVNLGSGDELQQLGSAFNAMVPQLEEHTRFSESLKIASVVQRQLLPHASPGMRGIDIAGFSLYADDTGGDYYDFLCFDESAEQRLGIVLGDVSGHGIGSALLMATVRATLHSAADLMPEPAALLQHINEKVADDLHAGQFMTLCYFSININNGLAQWCSAGHDPAIRFNRRSNTFSELVGNDIPLGVDPSWRYDTIAKTQLTADDWVFLGTDGIWEARNDRGEQYGKPRLRDLIRNHANKSAEEICNALTAELKRFQGDVAQRDDITAVVFRLAA